MSAHPLSFQSAVASRLLQEQRSGTTSSSCPLPSHRSVLASSSPRAPSWRAQVQFPQWGFPKSDGRPEKAQLPSVNAAPSSSASSGPPTVSDTKQNFLQAYPLPIPTIYNTVVQELLVMQHLARYSRNYQYDPIFALGFVTVFDQLMDGYPNADQREPIFTAYIKALQEDPAKYRADAERLEKWAAELPSATALVEFKTRDGGVEKEFVEIADRVGNGKFHYSRFFAVGLFRLLELAKASDPAVLQQLCEALGVNKMSVNRDLDVYRGLLSKLTQAKELLRDFLKREKAKKSEREQKAAEREKETADVKTE